MEEKYDISRQREFMLEIGKLCAFFRKKVLRMTLKEISDDSGILIPTLSSFELGRSSNIKFLYVYLISCETEQQKDKFINLIIDLLEGTYYNG